MHCAYPFIGRCPPSLLNCRNTHPVEVVQATGTDTAHDLNITFQIALDPQASLLFTFITALSD